MPLPGGPANKFGNRYEQCWTVRQLLRLIDEPNTSIRIEDPKIDKAEFVITAGSDREIHQAKRSHPSGMWRLSVLGSDQYRILQAIFNQLSQTPSTRFIFVSGSDAPELRELTERAKNANNQEEFESEFVDAGSQKKALKQLKDSWNITNTTLAYEILQRIEVRTIDETGIRDDVRFRLSAVFLTAPDNIYDALSNFVSDSIHQVITHDELKSYLDKKGLRYRQLATPNDAGSLITDVTQRYIEGAQRRLIRNTFIPRTETNELLNKIAESTSEKGIHCVVTGKAGGGKTCCLMQSIETFHQSDDRFTVLAFRLDRVGVPQSTKQLGKAIGLEESPVFVLGTAAKATSTEAVLIIDQLDIVSTTSGRNPMFFDVVENLLNEARGWHDSVRFHVIIACRMFDWENDYRLRRLLIENHIHISVGDFSGEQVKSILSNAGFDADSFTAKEFELLCLPQNLSLFVDTNHEPDTRPGFSSATQLMDHYWNEKRRAVNSRAASSADCWYDVIRLLCDEMSTLQQLSVLKEKLDQFPNEYLEQMASENVLYLEKQRYGFGHEIFFDYCFARNFIAEEKSLVEYLRESEQHLFRRAQVRQVLIYLRDADRQRYCTELSGLLEEERIRDHLKELAIALAFDMPDPGKDEWEVFAPWLESEINAIRRGQPNENNFTAMVWRQFRASQSWFQLTDSEGLILGWLGSGNDYLIDTAVHYMRVHQRHFGDRVAELLEPFVGAGGKWPQRFNHIMQWADHGNSPKLFNLSLRLVDDGTLDNARGPIVVNSDFWHMLYGMRDHLERVPEMAAHWLTRRLSRVSHIKDKQQWHNLLGDNNQGGMDLVMDAANAHPAEFVCHVLPVILKISDAAIYDPASAPPKRDAVWPILLNTAHKSGGEELFREALAKALEQLATHNPDNMANILEPLRERETYIANFFLLHVYTAGAQHFADEAAVELRDKPWRFHCGYSDTTYWIAMQLIKAIAPVCSDENRARLERTILDYVPDFERSPQGHRLIGDASFRLLSALPAELRSEKAATRLQELERKFGNSGVAIRPPERIEAGRVSSPIDNRAAEKMTDEQWLMAIKRYDTDDINWQHPDRGGAFELAGQLQDLLKQEPERFCRIALQLPADANPVYMDNILFGLRTVQGYMDMKLAICRKAYAESREHHGSYLAAVLGSIEDNLPDDAIAMLDWLATRHPDPGVWDMRSLHGDTDTDTEIITYAINRTRGYAVEAICEQVQRNAVYMERFHDTIEQLLEDINVPVRALTASILIIVAKHDEELAVDKFIKLVEPQGKPDDDYVLTTRYVYDFILNGLFEHFKKLQPVIKRMLRSDIQEAGQRGAVLASLAVLCQHPEAEGLVAEATQGKSSQRLGVAEVAATNIGKDHCREWAIPKLKSFFNDDHDEVRKAAAGCFRNLGNQSLDVYADLINVFCDSKAFADDSYSIMSALEETTQKLPARLVYTVCSKFTDRFGREAIDITQSRYVSVPNLIKVLFRAYHQNRQHESASVYLDAIDRMCLSGIFQVEKKLDEYEQG